MAKSEKEENMMDKKEALKMIDTWATCARRGLITLDEVEEKMMEVVKEYRDDIRLRFDDRDWTVFLRRKMWKTLLELTKGIK